MKNNIHDDDDDDDDGRSSNESTSNRISIPDSLHTLSIDDVVESNA